MENQEKELEAKIEKYTRISVMTMVFSIIAVIVILVFTAFLNNLLYYIPIFSYLVIRRGWCCKSSRANIKRMITNHST